MILASLAALLAAALTTGMMPAVRLRRRRVSPRTAGPQVDVWSQVVESIATGVRSGVAPVSACAAACRISAEVAEPNDAACLRQLSKAASDGADVPQAWWAVSDQLDDAGLRAVGAAWQLSEVIGAPLAEALTTAAELRRSEVERRARMKAALAAPTTSVNLLTGLPVAGAGLGVVLGVDIWQVYASPLALITVLPGVLLIVLGRWTCRRMIDRSSRTRRLK